MVWPFVVIVLLLLLYSNSTSTNNLYVALLCEGAFNDDCVIGILDSMLRSYSGPFLLILSRQKITKRIAFIQERFDNVFILDQTHLMKFRGNGSSGDSLVMVLVSAPNQAWIDGNHLPSIPEDSFSVYQYTKANTTTIEDTVSYYYRLHNRCNAMLSKSRSRKKKTMMTYNELGKPSTK